jgi:hypothetical protein
MPDGQRSMECPGSHLLQHGNAADSHCMEEFNYLFANVQSICVCICIYTHIYSQKIKLHSLTSHDTSSSLCSFLQPPKTSSLLVQVFSSAPCSQTPSVYAPLLTFKRRTFKMLVALAGRSLFKCPLLVRVYIPVAAPRLNIRCYYGAYIILKNAVSYTIFMINEWNQLCFHQRST